MAIKPVIAVAVAFVAGASVMYLWQGKREAPAGVDETRDVPVARITTSSASPQTPLNPAPISSAPETQESPPPVVQITDTPGTEFDGILNRNRVHEKFKEEVRDPFWAQEAEGVLMEFYAGKQDVVVSSIECRSTTCKVLLSGLPGMDEATLSDATFKPGSQPMRRATLDGKRMISRSVATEDKGSHSVAVATYRYAPDTRAPASE
jgi:hypothetical protein